MLSIEDGHMMLWVSDRSLGASLFPAIFVTVSLVRFFMLRSTDDIRSPLSHSFLSFAGLYPAALTDTAGCCLTLDKSLNLSDLGAVATLQWGRQLGALPRGAEES